MIVSLTPESTEAQKLAVCALAQANHLEPRRIDGATRTVICIVGTFNGRYEELLSHFAALDGVDSVEKISAPYKLASRTAHPGHTKVRVGNAEIGGSRLIHIAGPCAVESEEQIHRIARAVKDAGGDILRGGAFKPRTSPYVFQGLGVEGLRMLRDAGREAGLPVVTEVMETPDMPAVVDHADMLQIGARNMKNFSLLKEAGKTRKPVLLKRGESAKIDDLLMAAEYILAGGNNDVVLCERGVVTIDGKHTRNQIDLSAIPVLHKLTHLPVILDPSHAVGKPDIIPSMALAGVAAGADGIHIEVHDRPKEALCDGDQALLPETYAALVARMGIVREVVQDLYVRD